MILVTANKAKQILLLSFIGHVRAAEIAEGRSDLATLSAELSPGFTLLTDLTPLALLERECLPEIIKSMELCDQRGVGLVLRVIPDPTKDIGFNILSLFHYSRRPRIVTVKTMEEAAKVLRL